MRGPAAARPRRFRVRSPREYVRRGCVALRPASARPCRFRGYISVRLCVAPQLRSLAGARPARLHTRNALKAIWPFFTSLKRGARLIFGSYGFLGQEPGAPCPGQPKQRPKNRGGNPGARCTGIPRQRRPKNEAHVDELAGGANPWVKVVAVSHEEKSLEFCCFVRV